MQLNMETSIQARNIEEIMVTTTLDLVFTFLDISFIIPSCVHLNSDFDFPRPLISSLFPLCSIAP